MEPKRLYKSGNDKKIDGVCGGIAEYFEIDSTIVRLIWVIAVLFVGTGVLAYIVCMVVMPVNLGNDNRNNDYNNNNNSFNNNVVDSQDVSNEDNN